MANYLRQLRNLSVILTVGMATAGCVHLPGGISDSSTPLEGKSYSVVGSVEGTSSRVALLGILPLSGANRTDEALERAVKSKNGDALINVTVEFVREFWILWTSDTTIVRGEAIKFGGTAR